MTLTGDLSDGQPAFYLAYPDEERSWRERGACVGMPPEIFFPPESGSPPDYTEAEKVCDSCTVREECLEHALWWPEKLGYWGGMSERGRRLLKRRLRRAERLAAQ